MALIFNFEQSRLHLHVCIMHILLIFRVFLSAQIKIPMLPQAEYILLL